MEESIEYKILKPDMPHEDFVSFVDIINREWGEFHRLEGCSFFERLSSGGVFIGAYHNDKPAGILETIGLELDYSRNQIQDNPKSVARNLCSQVPSYDDLTDFGDWKSHPKYANTLILVDITKNQDVKNRSIAPGIVDYGKALLLRNPVNRPKALEHIKSILTFTPNIEAVKRWHKKQWAFDTEFVLKNARPGYKIPDVNFMCYLTPGYSPKIGQREVPKE